MIKLNVPTMAQCREEVAAKRVSERHDGRFSIFNYRPCCQYDDALWNPVNRACRGLIFDVETEKPVAVPFPKFFNVGQMPETDPERLSGLELIRAAPKFDGSLGIVWWDYVADRARVSTRGSFDSEQALWAEDALNKALGLNDSLEHALRAGFTHLCEIIYPANRVVVDYDFIGLVGLARVGPDHMLDFGMGLWPGMWLQTRHSHGLTLDQAMKRAQSETGIEGWVLTYSDGTMAKVKTEDYRKLHRLVAGVNRRRVWEVLSSGGTLEEEWAGLPDEYMSEAKVWKHELALAFINERLGFLSAIEELQFPSRKMAALWAQANLPSKWLAPFFAGLDDKPLAPMFWKLVKPEAET